MRRRVLLIVVTVFVVEGCGDRTKSYGASHPSRQSGGSVALIGRGWVCLTGGVVLRPGLQAGCKLVEGQTDANVRTISVSGVGALDNAPSVFVFISAVVYQNDG